MRIRALDSFCDTGGVVKLQKIFYFLGTKESRTRSRWPLVVVNAEEFIGIRHDVARSAYVGVVG